MAMFDSPKSGHDEDVFKATLDILWRRRKVIGITFLAFVLSAYAVILYPSSQYESSALVMVHLGRENTELPITVENGSLFTNGVQKEEINSYAGILTSRNLIEDTVDRIGIERYTIDPNKPKTILQYAKFAVKRVGKFVKRQVNEVLIIAGLRARLSDRDKVIKLLSRSLTAERVRDANVIQVSLRLADPVLARDTVAELLKLYQTHHIEMRQNVEIETVFAEQTDRYLDEVSRTKAAMQEIRNEWGISSVDDQLQQLARNELQAKYELDARRSQLADLKEQERVLQAELAKLPDARKRLEVKAESDNIRALKAEIVERKVELAEKYEPTSTPGRILANRIAELEALLAREEELLSTTTTYEPNALADDLKAKLHVLRAQQQGIQAAIGQDQVNIAALGGEISRLNQGADALELATLEYEALKRRYEMSAARVEQARADQQLDSKQIANVTIAGAPTLSFDPVAPRRLLLMGVAILAGLIVSCGLALLAEWLDPRVYAEEDLDNMRDIPFLGEYRLGNGYRPALVLTGARTHGVPDHRAERR